MVGLRLSGIGKSLVVHELHKASFCRGNLSSPESSTSNKRDIPYATLAQAFRTLIRRILSESEAEVERLASAIRVAVGPHGNSSVNLIPELEFVIGKQLLVAELSATEGPKAVFSHGVPVLSGSVCHKQHPLAIFLGRSPVASIQRPSSYSSTSSRTLERPTPPPDRSVSRQRSQHVSPLDAVLDAIRGTEAVAAR